MTNPIEIYQTTTGDTKVEVRFDNDTVWLSQAQMVQLFGRDVSVISRHIKNALAEGEITEKSNLQKMQIANSDRPVVFYDLETIISVGYRIKSQQGVAFRRWATARLKDYLLKGYAINQDRLAQNAHELEQALLLIQKTAKSPELTLDGGRGLVDIVSRYTQTFLWLQQYDEGLLSDPKGELGGTLPSLDEARQALAGLKADLVVKGEATELFAKERGDGLSAILGNLEQTVFGEPAYPSIEEKAAHLLYFVIKNHPFADGNKRSGAFLFVDFLHRNGRLFIAENTPIINDTGLTALALLIAESNPDNKETLIKLVVHMLQPR
ncbi:virulence protein RhuM/Fic/DOC family protein [Moraxella sp. FZLJ2107]|uniref:virulence protein RhuM/Fic/DOC family protein n=1 Tax=unclassified Moraxella TaxID=2685852 RepID=UPI0020C8FDBB|nr:MULTISPECIES: virulence protein RhuM/Fic/DOC family protein [unclassified Moraxella]UTO04165.1 virulence protein RhuM/Fic/DOC family protein [Moraxella sp. FZLJ2107]UTO22998.1 virulence protein RhuM/Fic/DOC family protein [Moraxella sp. FZLJ2109]